MKADADGVKHGAIEKVVKLKKGAKQASITGFLMTQREPLGEIGNNLMDSIKEEKNVVNDAPRKENMKVEKIIEKKQVEEAEDPGMVGLCEYEKIRLRNIRQREALFAELALQVQHSISKTSLVCKFSLLLLFINPTGSKRGGEGSHRSHSIRSIWQKVIISEGESGKVGERSNRASEEVTEVGGG